MICLEYDTVTWRDTFILLSTVSSHIMSLLYLHFIQFTLCKIHFSSFESNNSKYLRHTAKLIEIEDPLTCYKQ